MKKIDVNKLKAHATRQALTKELEAQLADFHLAESVEKVWESFRNIVHSSAVKELGHPTRKQHDWFDENDEGFRLC